MTEYDETPEFQKLNNPIQNPKVQRSSQYITFLSNLTHYHCFKNMWEPT